MMGARVHKEHKKKTDTFPCLDCGKLFAKREYVQRHKKRMHPAEQKYEEPPQPTDEKTSARPDLEDANPSPPKRKKPSNDMSKDFTEAAHMSRLPLWGVKGKDTFNIGAQYLEGLSSSKSFKDFAGAGTTHFKQFKVEFDLVKSWTWEWGEEALSESGKEVKMKEAGSKMKESLCKAVANFRVALAGATDPENLIFKKANEEDHESELATKKTVARNLLVCLSYLVARVVPSTRLALYVEFAQVLAIALSLGGLDKKWMDGVEEKWSLMVEQLKEELPELVNGHPLQMSFAGEQVDNTENITRVQNWPDITMIPF